MTFKNLLKNHWTICYKPLHKASLKKRFKLIQMKDYTFFQGKKIGLIIKRYFNWIPSNIIGKSPFGRRQEASFDDGNVDLEERWSVGHVVYMLFLLAYKSQCVLRYIVNLWLCSRNFIAIIGRVFSVSRTPVDQHGRSPRRVLCLVKCSER